MVGGFFEIDIGSSDLVFKGNEGSRRIRDFKEKLTLKGFGGISRR